MPKDGSASAVKTTQSMVTLFPQNPQTNYNTCAICTPFPGEREHVQSLGHLGTVVDLQPFSSWRGP